MTAPSQIAALLQPYIALDEQQLAQTSLCLDTLLKWNARFNLTAVREPTNIVTRHFGESFFAAARLLSARESRSVIDFGSGPGFPGIPLAMLAPKSQVALIESTGKKVAFLREVVRTLALNNVIVFQGRGENYPAQAELVTMRAVEKFESALPSAARLVEPGGRLALMIGRPQVHQAKTLVEAFTWEDPVDIPGGHSRVLLSGTRMVKVE